MKKVRRKMSAFLLSAVMLFTTMPAISLTAFAEAESVPINAETFPDANFRAYVSSKKDLNGDGLLSQKEIASVNNIYVLDRNIKDLSGIEYFTALESLSCYENGLTKLDVSKNPTLKFLHCDDNSLTELNLNNNSALEYLGCSRNSLSELDVSNNPALETISCSDNNLTNLDLSNNQTLKELFCYKNSLTALDLSNNTMLEVLSCYRNSLTTLDLSNNTSLTRLDCSHNSLTKLDLRSTPNYLAVDSQNSQLNIQETKDGYITDLAEYIGAENLAKVEIKSENWQYNSLTGEAIYLGDGMPGKLVYAYKGDALPVYTEMDVALTNYEIPEDDCLSEIFTDNKFCEYVRDIVNVDENGYVSDEEFASVISIDVSGMDITSLKGIEKFTGLEELYCNDNNLTELDLSNNSVLKELDCKYNSLTELDVSSNPVLYNLDCSFNRLTELDVSQNPELENLICSQNSLTKLDVSNNSLINWLNCGGNDLAKLDVSSNPNLMYLFCGRNSLTELDLSHNHALYNLDCGGNSLTELNVSNNRSLAMLSSFDNNLTELDVSNNASLECLGCNYNALTELDVSNNPTLLIMDCNDNKLTELDLSNNPALYILRCENNSLTEINLNDDSALRILDFSNNSLTDFDLSCTPNSFKAYRQTAQADISRTINGYVVNLAECVGSENLAKVEIESENWQYNTATGEAVYLGEGAPETLKYVYNGDFFPEAAKTDEIMDVTLTLNRKNEAESVPINAETFPDANFRAYVSIRIDRNGDGLLSQEEIALATKISVSYCDITDLAGIEYFNSLKSLYCDSNKLTNLDVSNNSILEELWCHNNILTKLDVSQNPKLESLNCSRTGLTKLDLSNNPVLCELDCGSNSLSELDLSNNPALISLYCGRNNLTELDVSNNASLELLGCNYNALTEINLSDDSALRILDCSNNSLTDFDLSCTPNSFKAYRQTAQADISKTSNGYVVNLAECVGSENLAKVEIESENWQYNAETGEAVYLGEGVPETLTYVYNGDFFPEAVKTDEIMDVTLTLNRKNSEGVYIDEAFTDNEFRDYISGIVNADANGYISGEKLAAVTSINVSGKNITSLKGIENFTALKNLNCENNSLTTLDLPFELEELSTANQHSTATLEEAGGSRTVDFKNVVGTENLNKVEFPEGQGWQYNSETGLAVQTASLLARDTQPETLTYFYHGDNLPPEGMKVTLTLNTKKSEKIVVMKKEQITAYVDGQILPMTDYGNGNFAMAKSVNGSYALPLRCIGEAFDMRVDYLGSGKTKLTNASGDYVVVTRDSSVLEKYNAVNELISSFTADFAAFTEAGITYVPMRAVSEALGLGVSYVGSGTTGHGSYVAISTDITLNLKQDFVLAEIEKAYALGL